jgi:hypothetical protein
MAHRGRKETLFCMKPVWKVSVTALIILYKKQHSSPEIYLGRAVEVKKLLFALFVMPWILVGCRVIGLNNK